MIASPAPALRLRATGPASLAGHDVAPLAEVLDAAGALMRPLFGPSEEHLNLKEAAPGVDPALMPSNLGLYYQVDCPEEKMEELAAKLRALPVIEAAYIKPPAEPATDLNRMLPRADDVPPTTPDFTGRQGFVGAAPAGVEATYAWTVPGGAGAGVRIIDVEGAWRFTHEDLTQNQGGVAGGTPSSDIAWRNHGTAVMGEISGDRNGFGITGISPDANVRGISIFGTGSSSSVAIRRAADLLAPGDIILIELHRGGPLATGVGQQGFIAVEWWPDDYDAIRYAIARGVIVVEAAGNGAQDLDNVAYDHPATGFPATWRNPFRRGARDSGAILVGAGAPPPGTHGADWGPDRSRLDFSNYGSAVDAQGWGREVTTTGYGDLQGGPNEDAWYTDHFSGTSSASPIIVGSLACIQGVRRARSLTPMTPSEARALLRATGSAQQDAPGRPATQRIGNRPNVRQMIARLPAPGVRAVPLHRYWNAGIGDHFYTTDWNELGSGRNGWGYEGVQCYVYPSRVPGTVPLYRYWNAGIGDHFYTTNWSELGGGAHGWGYEGVQCYVRAGAATGSVALYRYWNAGIGDHFYTTDWRELGSGAHGWGFEGVQCYVETSARVAAPVEPPLMAVQAGPEAVGLETQLEPMAFTTTLRNSFETLVAGVGSAIEADFDGVKGAREPRPLTPAFVDASMQGERSSFRTAGSNGRPDSFSIDVPEASRSFATAPGLRRDRPGRAGRGHVTFNIDLGEGTD